MAEKDYLRISGFEKNFSKFVVDPLYGSIGLTANEQRLADSGTFRRLKRIKQLGSVCEFYNGATHTRYDHSMGTLHITWIMFRRFVDNIQKNDAWVPKEKVLSFFSDDTIRALRTTALLHDLGHGPFSHYFEGISESMNAKVDHDLITPFLIGDQQLQETISKAYYKAIYSKEKLKQKFLRAHEEILDCLSPGALSQKKILCIMKPSLVSVADEGFEKVKEFLHDLIYGDVGSDRIDYLLRDTHFTGLGHRFDLSELLNNITAIYDDENDKLRFAMNSKGEDILDFFLTTRYYHYRLIANNLKNVDVFSELRYRVEKWLKHKDNILAGFLDLTLGDEVYFEKTVPALRKYNFRRVGSWTLSQIRADYHRFLIYRLLSDKYLKQDYLRSIQTKLHKEINTSLAQKMDSKNLRIESILEKPRIPIMPVYRNHYVEHKSNPEEENQLSSLIHDDSEMIVGLARTYVAHTTIVVYADKKYVQKVKKYTSKTFNFMVGQDLFQSVLKLQNLRNTNRLDVMLCALYYVLTQKADKPSTMSASKSESTPIKKPPMLPSLTKLFSLLRKTQNEFSSEGHGFGRKEGYKFGKKEGYDPEQKKSFDYPSAVINDLILFEYCGLIKLSKVNRNIRWWNVEAIPRYAESYELRFPDRAKRKFRTILESYPKEFQQKVETVCTKELGIR